MLLPALTNMNQRQSYFPHIIPHTVASNKETHASAKGERKEVHIHRIHWSYSDHPHCWSEETVDQPTADWVAWPATYLVGDSVLETGFFGKLTLAR